MSEGCQHSGLTGQHVHCPHCGAYLARDEETGEWVPETWDRP